MDIGDEIRLIKNSSDYKYNEPYINASYLKHGELPGLGEHGTILDIKGDYYTIRFHVSKSNDRLGNVQLAYHKDNLTLVKKASLNYVIF